MRTDQQIIDQLHKAVLSLLAVCDEADIFGWAVDDTVTSTARKNAFEALKASNAHHIAAVTPPPADETGHGICDGCGKMSDRLTGCDSPGDGKDVAGIAGVCLCPNCQEPAGWQNCANGEMRRANKAAREDAAAKARHMAWEAGYQYEP
jgi:hypothetical protein